METNFLYAPSIKDRHDKLQSSIAELRQTLGFYRENAEIEAIRLKGVNIVEFTFSLIKNEVSQIKDTEFHLDPREGSYDDWNELAKQLACDILTSRLYQTHPDILSEKERRIHL